MALTTFADPTRPLDGRVHVDGTDTEYAAARGVRPRSGTQRARVLEAFKQLGERGSTDFEMGERLGLFRWVAGTRREELIRDGWPIADSGERRATDTGASAIVWKFSASESPLSGITTHGAEPAMPGGATPTFESGAVPLVSPSAAPDSQLALALPGSVYRKDVAA